MKKIEPLKWYPCVPGSMPEDMLEPMSTGDAHGTPNVIIWRSWEYENPSVDCRRSDLLHPWHWCFSETPVVAWMYVEAPE